jgi:hypothetical protein
MKPGIFPDIPFPSQEFSQNPFKPVSVPVHRQEFSRIFLCSAGNSSKIFDNLSVYLFPARIFHGFSWIFLFPRQESSLQLLDSIPLSEYIVYG